MNLLSYSEPSIHAHHMDPVEAHLAHLQLRNLRPSTIEQRRLALRRLARTLGHPILYTNEAQLGRWYAGLKMTAESRACELSHVRSFYQWALLEELIDIDPTRRLIRPRLQRRIPRPIGEIDLARVLDRAPDRIRPWLYLAAYEGLRACEIANLRREDILDSADPPMLIVTDGKGGKQRLIPLSPIVAAALSPMPAKGWMFLREDGLSGPNAPWRVSQAANAVLHRLGTRATLHQLRHRFATKIYANSRDLRVTQELLGHASPFTTAGYAAHSPSAALDAVMGLQ
jgi:integrase/recombinase XerC